jgi:hypothetical protein
MKKSFAPASLLLLVLGSLLSNTVQAGPADYVYTPTVEYGEREIDFKYGSEAPPDSQPDLPRAYGASLGLGYGATEYWFTEIYLKHESESGTGVTLAEWENKFQLLETGKYPLDLGLITELETPVNGSAPSEIKVGPLLQSEIGKVQLNLNLLFERAFGQQDDEGTPFATVFLYQWQVKYRLQPTFEFGLQGFGEMGEWDNWASSSEQIHKVGPAVFGKIPMGKREAIKYNAALLKAASTAAPDTTFRLQVEYEF